MSWILSVLFLEKSKRKIWLKLLLGPRIQIPTSSVLGTPHPRLQTIVQNPKPQSLKEARSVGRPFLTAPAHVENDKVGHADNDGPWDLRFLAASRCRATPTSGEVVTNKDSVGGGGWVGLKMMKMMAMIMMTIR